MSFVDRYVSTAAHRIGSGLKPTSCLLGLLGTQRGLERKVHSRRSYTRPRELEATDDFQISI